MKKYQINELWDWVTHFEDESCQNILVTDMVLHVIQIRTIRLCLHY